jgi:DNA-binding transcriptional ArsR family regulator
LAQGEASVTELAAPFAMSMPAVSKHLKVLERAGLITRGREAQWRLVFTWGDEDVQLAVITLTFAEDDGGAAHLPSCPPRGHGRRRERHRSGLERVP